MRHLAFLLLVMFAAGGCGDGQASRYADWRPLLVGELAAADIDRPGDLYKFLHQGVMGPAHAVPDAAHARGWLEREWGELPEDSAYARPPLLTPLRPDGRLVRIDLVRLRDLGGSEAAAFDTLAAVFAATGQAWQRDPDLMAELWMAVEADTALWSGRFTAADLATFDAAREGAWPAVHHSKSYHDRCSPHYRVVDPRLLPAAWRETDGAP